MKLNREQQQAVEYVDGPLLVLAGAGSGKTRVITQKIAHLINRHGMASERIYAVTFTNKAAREMQNRVVKSLKSKQKPRLRIGTFHMLGLRILKKHIALFGRKRGFTIYDKDDATLLINGLMRKSNAAGLDSPETAAWRISALKSDMVTPEQAMQRADNDLDYQTAQLFEAYQKALETINAVDLDDLIYLPVVKFQQDNDFLDQWRARVGYMLVDEYQDTNTSQYALVKLLTGMRRRFTVVGDDDQAIYSWRGANPANLKILSSDFPDLKIIKLEQNYRSTKRILDAANSLIEKNDHLFTKALWSHLDHGERIRVMQSKDEIEEAERVVRAIMAHQIKSGSPYHHFAVLYRGNYQARPFERMLREYSIPYHLSGGTSFFDRAEVKDIMAYLKLITNPGDDNAFLRIINTPRREIGVGTLDKLKSHAQQREQALFHCCMDFGLHQNLPQNTQRRIKQFVDMIESLAQLSESEPVKAVEELLDLIQYDQWLFNNLKDEIQAEKRMENVNELVTWIKRLHQKEPTNLAEIVQKMTLINILDRDNDTREGCVYLMTLHAAKGLEFPHVYMVGMEERLLPHHASMEDDQIAEERRLAYVGMTRAQRHLTFSMAEKRKRQGGDEPSEPSRFLEEIDPSHLIWDNAPENREAVHQRGKDHIAAMRQILMKTTLPEPAEKS